MPNEEDHAEKVDGWMRAIEALLIQMPEVTEERIEAARAQLEADKATGRGNELLVKLRDQMRPDTPLDPNADAPLKSLLYKLKKHKS